jgi:NAD(P)-dependent dehydrogenase (short-subunit alcohol dehydrogenase family)
MKIIVTGGKGTIGAAVVKKLKERHVTSEDSIRKMFEQAGHFDAVVSAVGHVHFEDFASMTAEKYQIGLKDKLMGQVNLVLIGSQFINEKGSFTLTSGILAHDPIRGGSSAAMVNGALEGFVKGASIEMPKGIRLNCVCPTIVTESMEKYESSFRGFDPVPVKTVALAYSKSVEGLQTGQVYQVF